MIVSYYHNNLNKLCADLFRINAVYLASKTAQNAHFNHFITPLHSAPIFIRFEAKYTAFSSGTQFISYSHRALVLKIFPHLHRRTESQLSSFHRQTGQKVLGPIGDVQLSSPFSLSPPPRSPSAFCLDRSCKR